MINKIFNYVILYGAHGLKVFSFILLIPHFTKIFSKDNWGQVLIVQAIALWLQIVIEYGFNLSATRSMARVKEDPLALSKLVSGVIGAKVILSVIVILLAFLIYILLDNLKYLGSLIAWATAFAIMQGFNPIWYFLARDRFGQYAAIDFFARALYLILCLVFIKTNNQNFLIFFFGILTAMIANLAGYIIIFKQIPMRKLKILDSLESLKQGFSMFLFVSITSIYTTLNIVILGFSQPTAVVAAYATADRIVRASGGLLDPLNRVIYARLSHLYNSDFVLAKTFLRKSAFIIFVSGFAIFVFGEVLTPVIINLLAPQYSEAVLFMKILLFFIPILALNNIVGLHIMLPLGLDRSFNFIFITVSIFSVATMILSTPYFGSIGMAIITILTETVAFLGMIFMVRKSKVLKLSYMDGENEKAYKNL